MNQKLERLAAAGIRVLPVEVPRHYLLERDGFVALVERTPAGFGQIGSSGLLTGAGFAALVWRGGSPFFVTRAATLAATEAQVETLRRFAADLRNCLA